MMRPALALLVMLYPAIAGAESLKVRLEGDQLHIVAPDLRFFSQAALARLHDGATVMYRFRLIVSSTKSGDAYAEYTWHCLFSFDILEEKYKVSRIEPGYRSASHLSESSARDLCLDSLLIPVAGVSPSISFWISMVYEMEDLKSGGKRDNSPSILDTMVDIFGQRKKPPQPADTVRGGPFRMDDLRKLK
jgi:hypothetical protein